MFIANARGLRAFRWQPGRDLFAVLISCGLVVAGLGTATFLVGSEAWGGMAYFLVYGVITAAGFGVAFPVYWTVVIRRRPLSDLGITARGLWLSLALQVVFSVLQYAGTFAKRGFPAPDEFIPLLVLALAIGFFEALFWRGWVLLRLEDSFGTIPAILFGSLLYAVYHIGYGMPPGEMAFLFCIGVMYAVAFRLTKNIFTVWPVFQPMGQLFTLIKDGLGLPMLASLGFLEALILMFGIIWLGARYSKNYAGS